jgi:hypothetical protein
VSDTSPPDRRSAAVDRGDAAPEATADGRFRADGRGVSNTVAVVLILGMVVTSAAVVVGLGGSVLQDYQREAATERTLGTLERLDADLSSLAARDGFGTVELALGEVPPGAVSVVEEGFIRFTADRNASCRARLNLTSLRLQRGDTVFAFEAGGLWRSPATGEGSAMVSTPAFRYENRSLALQLLNLSGSITGTPVTASTNVTGSANRTDAVRQSIFGGSCSRPTNLTVQVQSDFYEGWEDYLTEELNATERWTNDSNRTVSYLLGQDRLPRAFDETRNAVVDLSNRSRAEITNTSIELEKNASVSYPIYAAPLGSGPTVSRVQDLPGGEVYRRPIDVVFVFDESGSMNYEADGDSDADWCNPFSGARYGNDRREDCTSKMDLAKDAAKAFVAEMNVTFDRGGVVGFADPDLSRFIRTSAGRYLTGDFTASGLNGSIDSLTTGGGTHSWQGLHRGNQVLYLKSNASRDKVVVLLSDGNDDVDARDPMDAAAVADQYNITVHTVGFGNPDNATLQRVADRTGGTFWYSNSASELDAVFEDLFSDIAESTSILRDPVSTRLDAGRTAIYPQLAGNTTQVASADGADNGTILNVNDPTAPSQFRYSFTVSDSVNVSMNALSFDCERYERTGEVVENESTNTEYNVARCAEINESSKRNLTPSRTRIFRDGETISGAFDTSAAWWQESVNETLGAVTEGDNRTLDLQSNEAVVVFDYDEEGPQNNRLVMLYRVGQSTAWAPSAGFFNVEVSEVRLESE